MVKAVMKILVLTMVLTGCVRFYPEVSQGRGLNYELLSQVEVGMTKDEVERLAGLPLLNLAIQDKRWTYVGAEGTTNGLTNYHHVIIDFNDDKVVSIKGLGHAKHAEAEGRKADSQHGISEEQDQSKHVDVVDIKENSQDKSSHGHDDHSQEDSIKHSTHSTPMRSVDLW
jgi:outer membrane protein assembly factor BamE (lipoprotein component of BamABCDE complex)